MIYLFEIPEIIDTVEIQNIIKKDTATPKELCFLNFILLLLAFLSEV